jgi:hypothetical protein
MNSRALIILAVLFGLFIVLGIISKIRAAKIKDGLKIKGWRRLKNLFLTMGITGLVYLFFAWQGIALLAARFWLIIWLLVTLIWLGFIGRYLFWEVPKLRRNIEQKRKFEEYLP